MSEWGNESWVLGEEVVQMSLGGVYENACNAIRRARSMIELRRAWNYARMNRWGMNTRQRRKVQTLYRNRLRMLRLTAERERKRREPERRRRLERRKPVRERRRLERRKPVRERILFQRYDFRRRMWKTYKIRKR